MTTHPVRGDQVTMVSLVAEQQNGTFSYTLRFAKPESMHGFRIDEDMIISADCSIVVRTPVLSASVAIFNTGTVGYDDIICTEPDHNFVKNDATHRSNTRCVAQYTLPLDFYSEDFQSQVLGTAVVKKYENVKYHPGFQYYFDSISATLPFQWIRNTLRSADMILTQVIPRPTLFSLVSEPLSTPSAASDLAGVIKTVAPFLSGNYQTTGTCETERNSGITT